jgi:RHH-type proline utilization regulon transcriptional repressor/proline dehydrogenase/delta 1-pyrroline-5-carboxylate dehydrogenase
MLEGMANQVRRIVQKLTSHVLLYSPVVQREDFSNAVAYLIRRLDENTAPDNFLTHLFGLHPGSKAWEEQLNHFTNSYYNALKSMEEEKKTYRVQNRFEAPLQPMLCSSFSNEADTDWALPSSQQWAAAIIQSWRNKEYGTIPLKIDGKEIVTENRAVGEDPSRPGISLYHYSLAEALHIDVALSVGLHAHSAWSKISPKERSMRLAEVARCLRYSRADLIGVMIADTGKGIAEADAEVSEAVDFIEYYRRNVEEMATLEGIQWVSKGTVLVTPPWNFPCSIPVGAISAALAAGNCVIFKPAPEAVLVGWEVVQLFWKAGISSQVLQFITCVDEPIGSLLIQDPRIHCILLTGATATARQFMRLRPDLDLIAETGGKNSLIVTAAADRDLAVRDIVQSAFGYAGQKCSACSLVICEAEVYDDARFRRQLRDAAKSWKVGSAWDLSTRMGPLIRPPNASLKRGLTLLEEGEEWLLEPREDPHNPQMWSPGIKWGVKPQSFTHQTELFGPVLGVMRAKDLQHAIELANGTPYGLTTGLHSLDEREHAYWSQRIEAGNCYINRGITGAIVQRQPFGGCKASNFGLGGKAGGPNYVLQLMRPTQEKIFPLLDPSRNMQLPSNLKRFAEHISGGRYSLQQYTIWEASVKSYLFFWQHYFKKAHDPSKLLGQDNLFSYRPRSSMVFRIGKNDDVVDALRGVSAAVICKTPLEISCALETIAPLLSSVCEEGPLGMRFIRESEEMLRERIAQNQMERIRFLSDPSSAMRRTAADAGVYLYVAPVIANGRLELLHYMREVSLSMDYHRYGNLGIREDERQEQTSQQECSSCSCRR